MSRPHLLILSIAAASYAVAMAWFWLLDRPASPDASSGTEPAAMSVAEPPAVQRESAEDKSAPRNPPQQFPSTRADAPAERLVRESSPSPEDLREQVAREAKRDELSRNYGLRSEESADLLARELERIANE